MSVTLPFGFANDLTEAAKEVKYKCDKSARRAIRVSERFKEHLGLHKTIYSVAKNS
jgi:CelD/BcsL family acetyltransferase involved in cellulose biosynthesis